MYDDHEDPDLIRRVYQERWEDRHGDMIESFDPVASEVWLASGEIVASDTHVPTDHEALCQWWDHWAPTPEGPSAGKHYRSWLANFLH